MNSSILHSPSLYFSLNLTNLTIPSMNNQTLALLSFYNSWMLPIFILSLLGILFTIVLLYSVLYVTVRYSNNHLILTNLFICLSVAFLYLVVIFFLIHGNEILCGLREFLSQLVYAFLYSALLCRYIMQWLSARILSHKTKQLTSLLIYVLLILIQIPIGILWWYFTFPRFCQQRMTYEYPKLRFDFQKRLLPTSSIKSCAHQCVVDYRFYATYTYTIVELFLCTIIAICLFLCRHCRQNKIEKEQLLNTHKYHTLFTFLDMFAFILIDIVWLTWTFVYHFTSSSFAFSSLVIGMFIIGTICLFFILLPQIYYYLKSNLTDIYIPSTTLFSNRLASIGDLKEQDALLRDTYKHQFNRNKHRNSSNESEASYELGTSGTFLPITRTPKGPFKVINTEKTTPNESYEEQPNTVQISNTLNELIRNEKKTNMSIPNQEQQLQFPIISLQRQSTSSSNDSNPEDGFSKNEYFQRYHPSSSSPIYYSRHTRPHPDESIIPILCSSQTQPTVPPKMRVVLKTPALSIPKTHHIYSDNDHQYIPYAYQHTPSRSQPPPPVTPSFYPSPIQQHYFFVDSYQAIPSYPNDHIERIGVPSSYQYPSSYRQYSPDNRLLSQRLWAIDSEDEEDEIETNFYNTYNYTTSTRKHLKDFQLNQIDDDDHIVLHVDYENDEDEEQEKSFDRKLVHI